MSESSQPLANKVKKVERNSSFELLRIISMLSIAICHFATHGGFAYAAEGLSIPKLWWYFIEMGGNFGVDVFVLISGYFLITAKNGLFSAKRILKFWGQVFFYSVLIYAFFVYKGTVIVNYETLKVALFPLTFGKWWFASTYFVLYLIHPFLNLLLNKIDKKTYQWFLVLLIFIWCFIPTVSFSAFESNRLIWFITLYSIAGYVRLFGTNRDFKVWHYILFWLLFTALRYSSSILIIIFKVKPEFAPGGPLSFYGTQSILTFLSAYSLFMAFKNINLGYKKWINVIASASFGVYLIHDNGFVRSYLWFGIFKNATYQETLRLIPYSIGVICFVYAVCTVIDLIRQLTIEKIFLSFVNKSEERISNLFKSFAMLCKRIIFGKEKNKAE